MQAVTNSGEYKRKSKTRVCKGWRNAWIIKRRRNAEAAVQNTRTKVRRTRPNNNRGTPTFRLKTGLHSDASLQPFHLCIQSIIIFAKSKIEIRDSY